MVLVVGHHASRIVRCQVHPHGLLQTNVAFHLHVELVWLGVTLDEEVQGPLDRVKGVLPLIDTLVGRLIPQHARYQHGHRG